MVKDATDYKEIKYVVVPDELRGTTVPRVGSRLESPLMKAILKGETVFVSDEEATKSQLNGYYEAVKRAVGKKLSVQKSIYNETTGNLLFIRPEAEEGN